jgi:hypothetical protein
LLGTNGHRKTQGKLNFRLVHTMILNMCEVFTRLRIKTNSWSWLHMLITENVVWGEHASDWSCQLYNSDFSGKRKFWEWALSSHCAQACVVFGLPLFTMEWLSKKALLIHWHLDLDFQHVEQWEINYFTLEITYSLVFCYSSKKKKEKRNQTKTTIQC